MSIRLENVSKSFKGKKALDDISVEFEDKSFSVILGRTGHGKTTLLRILAGVESVDAGKIYFDGNDVTDIPPQKRKVSMVYQDFALYPVLSVYENIASPLRVSGKDMSSGEIDKAVREKAELLNIGDLLDRQISELSGGEQQRVAICRALVKEANLMLLDEPLTNLDYKLRESMRVEIRKLFDRMGGTVIYATSEPLEALSVGTHVAFILDGKIHQYAPAEEVYYRPKNVDVASYFSYPSMNLFNAELIEETGRHYLQASEELKLEVTHMRNLLTEKRYILGVRAGKLHEEKKRDVILITPTVELSEVRGSETIVHLKYGGLRICLFKNGVTYYDSGRKLKLFIDPEDFYIFSKQSGKTIEKYKRLGWKGGRR